MSSVPKGLRAKVDALLSSIIPLYEVEEDGSISTSNPGADLYEGALIQLLDVGPSNLTVTEFEYCARRALLSAIRSRIKSYAKFECEMDREIEAFKRQEYSCFEVCSRCYFSVPPGFRLDIELWGAKLTLTHGAPDGLSASQPSLSNGQKALAAPEFGAYLSMRIYERTRGGALDHASHDISFLLGILNFSLNLGNITFYMIANERTLAAAIFPGREIFLLDEDGAANEDIWRYYTSIPKYVKSLSSTELKKLENHVKIIDRLNKLSKHDRIFYRQFFELYFEALSELDGDAIVMRLWKAAEHLTMAQSAQQIANRLALTWSDREAVSAVCYALGQRRNWIMHNAKPNARVEDLPEHFRHFLENLAWKSLATDVKSVAHWKAIMQMSDMDIDFDLAADAVDILKALQ